MASAMTTVKTSPKKKAKREPGQPVKQRRAKKPALLYVRDEQGRPVAVVVPIAVFEELVEAAEQRDDIAHLRRNQEVAGEPIPLEELEARLRAEGKLP